MAMVKGKIRVGHSPDADDAFMFYGIACGGVDTSGLTISHVVEEIQALNERSFRGELEVTAISAYTYFEVADKYTLMSCGASIGDNYGPILVTKKPAYSKDLKGKKIAVPGLHTTAYLTLKLFLEDFKEVVVPFDKILEAVEKGEVDAGLIIHEGQLTYKSLGFHKVADLGEWFYEMTKLPLPLGVDVIRKSLGRDIMRKTTRLLKDSIVYGLKHREEALKYAMKFGRGIETPTADEFVGMYVNDFTVDMGRRGKEGLFFLHKAAVEAGLVKKTTGKIEFVDMH